MEHCIIAWHYRDIFFLFGARKEKKWRQTEGEKEFGWERLVVCVFHFIRRSFLKRELGTFLQHDYFGEMK